MVSIEGSFIPDVAFWSAQLARTAPSGVGGLLAADRADPARWLREAGITPGRAAALAPGAATGLCYYGT